MGASNQPSWGLKSGRKCYVTSAFLGVSKQKDKIKSGCLTAAFSGAQKCAEGFRSPFILGGPQTRGQNQKWLPHPCLLECPQVGGSAMRPLHCRGSSNKQTRGQNQKWLSQRCLVGGSQVSGVPKQGDKLKVATSSLPSPRPKSVRKCYKTSALSGVSSQGDKIKSGCLSLACLGAHKWAEVLRNPDVLGGPQTRGQTQKWLPHHCLLGGPQVGGCAT